MPETLFADKAGTETESPCLNDLGDNTVVVPCLHTMPCSSLELLLELVLLIARRAHARAPAQKSRSSTAWVQRIDE